MKLSDAVEFTPLTKKEMYSTMVPTTTPRRRYFETGQSMSLRKSMMNKTVDIEPAHMAATFTK